MKPNNTYPIGRTGVKWNESEKSQWLAMQNVKRSYADDVLSQLDALANHFDIEEYARLDYASGTYPLFALGSLTWDKLKPNVLITGGVHGYETSGVHGALRFAASAAKVYPQL